MVCSRDYYPFLIVAVEGGTFHVPEVHRRAYGARDEACQIREVLDHIGGKWSIGIIVAAADGPIRFTELERTIEGISRRILTLNLRKLERDGLLIRTVYPTVPPKVEYSLTPIARELDESFATLTACAERHRHAIVAARRQYDRPLGHHQGEILSHRTDSGAPC